MEEQLSLIVIHIHLDLKMFITIVWNDQQSFYLHHFHIIIFPIIFCVCQISMYYFIIELQYNQSCINTMTLNYTPYSGFHLGGGGGFRPPLGIWFHLGGGLSPPPLGI